VTEILLCQIHSAIHALGIFRFINPLPKGFKMSPQAGWILQEEIVPRLRASIPRNVSQVGAEDPEELIQDATAIAAKMLHSAEAAGKKVTSGNIAFYAVQHIRSGRRSTGSSRVDAMASGTQLAGHTRLHSLNEVGLVHSSAATDLISLIVGRLNSDGDLETKGISPSFLIRNWPPAFKEWSTKSVRDAFFASPQFPRLTNPDVLKETISRGVGNGLLAYVSKTPSGGYKPFYYNQALMTADVEISDEMFIVTKETAEAYQKTRATAPAPVATPTSPTVTPPVAVDLIPKPSPTSAASGLTWTGEIPPQKWMNFYTKVLSKFASARGLKLTVKVEVSPEGGVSKQKLAEIKSALRELGLNDDVGQT
jgi:hypothetical protein